MKKRKLRMWVKVVLFIVGAYVGLNIGESLVSKIQYEQQVNEQAINYCVSQGRSEQKCIEGLYGN